MQRPAAILVNSVPTVDFIAACAQNAGIAADLKLPKALARQGESSVTLRGITILSVENLAWEVWLYGKSTGATGDCTTEQFLGKWTFAAADGTRVGGAGLYHYFKEDLDFPYLDKEDGGKLHVLLVNLSAASKTANAGGAIKVSFALEPTTAW